MPLKNFQYDALMRNYNQKQFLHKHEQDERIQKAEAEIPRLSEIRREIASLGLQKARFMLGASKEGDFDLTAQIQRLALERSRLLTQHGYPENYLELHYDCPLCKDTGFILTEEEDGPGKVEKCSCFRKAAVDLLYTQSNIRDILNTENFDHAKDNLLIYGDTGVGKTYLTHCIAKELLDRSYFVLYFTAFDLFDLLSKNTFQKDAESEDMASFIFECDLLIIDDLGTELTNSFISSQLFCCINERILNKKATIISTHLTMEDFLNTYSERTFSRVTSNYTMLKLVGNDIRIQKKLLGGKEKWHQHPQTL